MNVYLFVCMYVSECRCVYMYVCVFVLVCVCGVLIKKRGHDNFFVILILS